MVKFPAAFVSRIVPLVAFLVLSAPAGAGEIRGRILVAGRADKPALGVTISAVPWETPGDEARREMKGGEPPKPIASATSGADGSFVLTVPPAEPGREKLSEKLSEKLFRVRAEGAGIVPVLFEGVYDAAETEDLGEHTLPHGERLSGIAVDAAGKPLAGAAVSLEPGVAGGDDLAYRVVARTAVTGEDGKFQFDGGERHGEPHHDREGRACAGAGDGPPGGRSPASDHGRGRRSGDGRRARRRQETRRGRPREAREREGDDALGRDGR